MREEVGGRDEWEREGGLSAFHRIKPPSLPSFCAAVSLYRSVLSLFPFQRLIQEPDGSYLRETPCNGAERERIMQTLPGLEKKTHTQYEPNKNKKQCANFLI